MPQTQYILDRTENLLSNHNDQTISLLFPLALNIHLPTNKMNSPKQLCRVSELFYKCLIVRQCFIGFWSGQQDI